MTLAVARSRAVAGPVADVVVDNAKLHLSPMLIKLRTALPLAILLFTLPASADFEERDFLTRIRRLTVEGKRAGEGYWSPDGKRLVFQSEREPGNPFYQIYTLDLESGDTKRISPGLGKTTCAFFRPGTRRRHRVRLHARRSEIEAVPGRGERVPRLGQGTPLFLGLRPRDGHLRPQRPHGHAHAADDRPGVRRRGQLLAGRPVDRVHVDARRLQPDAHATPRRNSSRSIPATSPRSTS